MTAPRIHATRRPVRHPFAPGSPSAPFAAGGVEPVGAPTAVAAAVGANPSTNAATAIAAQHREDPR